MSELNFKLGLGEPKKRMYIETLSIEEKRRSFQKPIFS